MTSVGFGILQEPPEFPRSFGDFGVEDGVEGFIVEILREKNLAIPAQEALIFLQREHHHARRAMALDTHRVKHRLIGVIAELARDLLRRDRLHRFRHAILPRPSARVNQDFIYFAYYKNNSQFSNMLNK